MLLQSMYPQHVARRLNPSLGAGYEFCEPDYGGLILAFVTSSLIQKPMRTNHHPFVALPRPRVHPMWPQHANTPAAASSTHKVAMCTYDKINHTAAHCSAAHLNFEPHTLVKFSDARCIFSPPSAPPVRPDCSLVQFRVVPSRNWKTWNPEPRPGQV